MHELFLLLDKLPVLNSQKDPVKVCLIGVFFGFIGLGIYLESFTDFLIPFLFCMLLVVIIPGLGLLPGWILSGLYGYFRVLNSNERRRL